MNLKQAIKQQSKKTKAPKAPKVNGYTIYEGASKLDPTQNIAAILTLKTANEKTGQMAQLWIIHQDVKPTTASKTGQDAAVCGDCPLRHHKGGACYVTLFHAPLKVFKSYKKRNYPQLDPTEYKTLLNGLKIRFGAYGDPAALPVQILAGLKAVAVNNTSYTHQWKKAPELKTLSMASVDNIKEAKQATKKGWRYFRVATEQSELLKNEIICPNVTSGTSCAACGLCNGKRGAEDKRKNIVIPVHGNRAKKFNY